LEPFEAEVAESQAAPYLRDLGIVVEAVEAGRAVLRLPMAAHLETFRVNGVMHGGAVASLIDAAAGMALRTLHKPGEPPWRGTATSDLNVSYLNAAMSDLTAEARVLREGRALAFFEVEVRNTDGEAVAIGRVTMYIRRD
jgi:uncharacterized protein (TIGR00369 family)